MKNKELYIGSEIDVLKLTLNKFDIPERRFSAFEEKDESLCLNYYNNMWITYIKQEDRRINFNKFGTFGEARNSVFRTFSNDEKDIKKMERFYRILNIQLKEANVDLETADDIANKQVKTQKAR